MDSLPSTAHRIPTRLRRAYTLMRRHYGHQHWWPGDTPFEVCIGAILTQNTNWTNVERAIANLKQANALTPLTLLSTPVPVLHRLLRPAGYFKVKTRRVRAFVSALVQAGSANLDRFLDGDTAVVRRRLLDISGIGPETADSILLYAGNHLSFVVDAYTRRIFTRHNWCPPNSDYAQLQTICAASLKRRSSGVQLDYWQDYHAQLVNIGKDFCRTRNPLCRQCPLETLLPQ